MALIIGGKEVPCAAHVVDWRVHGYEFKPGRGGRRRNPKVEVDLMVWHWTAGESDNRGLFGILDRRELGVEFGIDRSGVIWQYCDPLVVDTWDAGSVNPRSMGVEIANYGAAAEADIPRAGRDRPRYQTTMHGRARTFAAFYPAQLEAAWALAEAVSEAHPAIMRQVPRDPMTNELIKRVLVGEELTTFAGHIGHFHVTDQKVDPGTDLLELFKSRGY